MIGFLRLLILGFAILTLIYLAATWYARTGHRARLEQEYYEEMRDRDFHNWVQTRMAEYERSLRRKLLWGIYVVPALAISVLIYILNFQ